ncbi:glycoside hydrolase family 18 protein [Mycena galericulata]|nr:glycoside hydrolase family 18 protein [Mycena galericulata]
MMLSSGILSVLAWSAVSVFGYDPTRSDNLVVYWGQNSYGAVNPSNTANWQQTISTYCQDTIINAIPIAFVDIFFSTDGLPDLNLANASSFLIPRRYTCSANSGVFAGTGLANCQFLAAGIEACQAAGKIITISLGGASGAGAQFTSAAEGTAFANTIWDLFLGGSSSTRPFGAAVLDGVDLDIEGGSPTGFAAFAAQIRTLTAGASKPYYITAAPQCPYPDAILGSVINTVGFDAVYVQFYNGVDTYPNTADWDFSSWDTWAKTVSPNPNVKVFIGAPAAPSAANPGYYVDAATLGSIVLATRAQYSSLGGVMLWDASQAYANGRYDMAVKNIITTSGGATTTSTTKTTSTTSTTKTTTTSTTTTKTTSTTTSTTSATGGSCATASPWVSSVAYPAGSEVTYNGDLWQSSQWSDDEVPGGVNGAWSSIGVCTAAATAKVAPLPATAATLTGTVHATPTASSEVKASAATAKETGAAKVQGRGNSRAFKL